MTSKTDTSNLLFPQQGIQFSCTSIRLIFVHKSCSTGIKSIYSHTILNVLHVIFKLFSIQTETRFRQLETIFIVMDVSLWWSIRRVGQKFSWTLVNSFNGELYNHVLVVTFELKPVSVDCEIMLQAKFELK